VFRSAEELFFNPQSNFSSRCLSPFPFPLACSKRPFLLVAQFLAKGKAPFFSRSFASGRTCTLRLMGNLLSTRQRPSGEILHSFTAEFGPEPLPIFPPLCAGSCPEPPEPSTLQRLALLFMATSPLFVLFNSRAPHTAPPLDPLRRKRRRSVSFGTPSPFFFLCSFLESVPFFLDPSLLPLFFFDGKFRRGDGVSICTLSLFRSQLLV